jgi:Arc/MetJ family transcription regulator
MQFLVTALLSMTLAVDVPSQQAAAPIAVQIILEKGAPLTASQEWYKLLTGLGVSNLRIYSGSGNDQIGIKSQGSRTMPRYEVTGILGSDNSLRLPGAKFSLRDKSRLRAWLDRVADQGPEAAGEARAQFGLLPSQLEQVRADLKEPVDFSTKGQSANAVLTKISGRLALTMEIDSATAENIKDLLLEDEMHGLARGTATAMMLRHAGLVFAPERPPAGRLRYVVRAGRPDRDQWPVGWAPKDPPLQTLSGLFEFLNVEIDDTPLAEVVQAIEVRLRTPILVDRGALARQKIQWSTLKATLPGKRATYSQTLKRALSQSKLGYELRLDDAGHPFLWVTTLKILK